MFFTPSIIPINISQQSERIKSSKQMLSFSISFNLSGRLFPAQRISMTLNSQLISRSSYWDWSLWRHRNRKNRTSQKVITASVALRASIEDFLEAWIHVIACDLKFRSFWNLPSALSEP
uniref:(northern house mosquito) hypothetical protein n=1 Tax=Culex pipiens TaxID=7175 RepID=A0A8D8GKQ2_CULPI